MKLLVISKINTVNTFLSKISKKLIVLKASMKMSDCKENNVKSIFETSLVEHITTLESFAHNYTLFMLLWQSICGETVMPRP